MKNMYLKAAGIFFFSTLIFIQCSPKQEQTIAEEKEQLPYIVNFENLEFTDEPQGLSEFAESIEYIRLADEPLLEEANSMMDLYVTEEEDFCITRKLHYTFDKNGKFKKSLYRIGQGPGEVVQALNRPIYNLKGNDITIWNYGVGYSKFDKDNGLIENMPSSDSTRMEKRILAYIGNKEVFFYSRLNLKFDRGEKFNLDGPVLWYVKDTSTDKIVYTKENPLVHVETEKGRGMAVMNGYPFKYNQIDSVLWVKHMFQDTIYQTKDGIHWQSWYAIKHHSSDFEYKELMQMTTMARSPKEIAKSRILGECYPLPTGVIFSYSDMNKKGGAFVGFCKHNEPATIASKNSFKNDLDNHLKQITFTNVPIFQRNGYLYLLIDAYKFFEDGNTPPFPELVEDSNPVIVKMKLKQE